MQPQPLVLKNYSEIECLAAGVRWSWPFIKGSLKPSAEEMPADTAEDIFQAPHPIKRLKKIASTIQQVRDLRDSVEIIRGEAWEHVHGPIRNWFYAGLRDRELNLPPLTGLASVYARQEIRREAANQQALDSLDRTPLHIFVPLEHTELAVEGLRLVAQSPRRGYENIVDRTLAEDMLRDHT